MNTIRLFRNELTSWYKQCKNFPSILWKTIFVCVCPSTITSAADTSPVRMSYQRDPIISSFRSFQAPHRLRDATRRNNGQVAGYEPRVTSSRRGRKPTGGLRVQLCGGYDGCLLNILLRLTAKKTSNVHITGPLLVEYTGHCWILLTNEVCNQICHWCEFFFYNSVLDLDKRYWSLNKMS